MSDDAAPFAPGSTVTDTDLNCLSAPCKHFVDLNFERVDLCGAHLEKASFERCNFSDVELIKALLNGARLIDCIFRNCSLFRADMVGVQILRCQFENCDFAGTTLSDGYLEDVQFIGCPIEGSPICDNQQVRVAWQLSSMSQGILANALIDHDAIAARHSELLSQMLGGICQSDAYRTFDGDEGQVLLIDADGYHLVSYERGQENGRQSTCDVEELLFWFLAQTAFSIGWAYEFANRVEGPDVRRMVHDKQRELFARLEPKWSARLEAKIAATLAAHPYLDTSGE